MLAADARFRLRSKSARNDWKAIGARYRPLVKHVKHRADLTYIIGEMIAELNLGHAYAGGGDLPNVPKVELVCLVRTGS